MISTGVLTRLWWGIGFALVIAATITCLVPGKELPAELEWNDKLSHIVGHGGLALWFAGIVARRSWWKLFLSLLAFGIAIEFAQYFMHFGREADWRDVVANGCGALLGLVVARLGLERWPQWAAWLLGNRQVRT